MSAEVEGEFDRARVLAGTGRTDEAEHLLEGILARSPHHLGALLLRGALHGEEREWEKALAAYGRAVEAWPRSSEALNALARCLHGLGRDDEALERAEEARRLLGEGDNSAHTAPVYLTLIWCLRERRRYREAIALAEEGLERVPDAVLAHWATQLEDELVAAEKDEC